MYEQPVISLDISRTALAVGGAKPEPDSSRLEGVNLLPYFRGETDQPPHEALFWRQASGDVWAARTGDWKLLRDGRGSEGEQLYHLAEDISESNDLAGEDSNRVDTIRRQYDQWNGGNKPAFFPSYSSYWPHMDKVYREISGGESED